MEHTLVFHILSLGKQAQKALGYKPYPYSLGVTQASAIIIISQEKSVSQREIASHLHLEPATVVRLVDELQKLDLVKRLEAEGDRRRYEITLTRKGQQAVTGIEEITQKLERFLKTKLDAGEVEFLMDISNKISRELDEWQNLQKGGENAIQSPKRSLEVAKSKFNHEKRKSNNASQMPRPL